MLDQESCRSQVSSHRFSSLKGPTLSTAASEPMVIISFLMNKRSRGHEPFQVAGLAKCTSWLGSYSHSHQLLSSHTYSQNWSTIGVLPLPQSNSPPLWSWNGYKELEKSLVCWVAADVIVNQLGLYLSFARLWSIWSWFLNEVSCAIGYLKLMQRSTPMKNGVFLKYGFS